MWIQTLCLLFFTWLNTFSFIMERCQVGFTFDGLFAVVKFITQQKDLIKPRKRSCGKVMFSQSFVY